MPPRAFSKGLDPVVDELVRLAHHDQGVTHAAARRPEALLALPAVRRRLARDPSHPARAIADAIDDLEASDVASLSSTEFAGLRVLLGIDRAPVIDGRTIDLSQGQSTAYDRAEYAVILLHPVRRTKDDKTYWFRRARPAEGEPVSREWILFSRLRADLERLEPPDSLNRGTSETPMAGAGIPMALAEDLIGTWRGVVTSPMMLRVQPGPDRPEQVDGYLVFSPENDGTLTVVNFVEYGLSRMIAQRIVDVDGHRRLIAVYEARTGWHTGPDPSHRGAMFLTVEGRPASRLEGPFWTDRMTYGRLSFTDRRAGIAETYDTASKLWRQP